MFLMFLRLHIKFSIFQVTTWSSNLVGGVHLTWIKFWSYRRCESPDIAFFNCHLTARSEGFATLWIGYPHPKLPLCQVWHHQSLASPSLASSSFASPLVMRKSRNNVFSLSHNHVFKRLRDLVGRVFPP